MESVLRRLDDISDRLPQAPRRIVDDAAEAMTRALVVEAPKRTGALAAGIHSRVEGGPGYARASFWARAPYTPYVLGGTRPHEIVAGFYSGRSGKRTLAWPGMRHPVARVHHPGTRPNPFNVRAFQATLPRIRAIASKVGRWVLGG